MLAHRSDQVESESTPDCEKKKNPLRRDPLKWFGVLVPNSLRQAQKSYQRYFGFSFLNLNALLMWEIEIRSSRAIEYSVDAANAKNELLGVENRRKYLNRLEEKMAKSDQKTTEKIVQ